MQFTNLFQGVADYDQTFTLINRGYQPHQRSAGQFFETTEEIFHYFLNILPPMDWTLDATREAFSMCEFSTGNLTDAFIRSGDRFFCLCISRERSSDFNNSISAFCANLSVTA